MPAMDLRETHQIGANTHEWMVGKEGCPALAAYHIRLAGVSAAKLGFEFVREHPPMSQILACHSGEGEVLIDGAWQPCRAGSAYLTPTNALHAYRALKDQDWGVCWVMFDEISGHPPVVTTDAPVLATLDPRPLLDAIQGLYREAVGPAEPALMHHWVELIQLLAARVVRPWHTDERLYRLWELVDADLAHRWTLADLTKQAKLSGEHLRRLCHKHLGRSPLEHVTFLRMRRAASLLTATPQKIEAIASAVGYDNPFAFSTAFKRLMKQTPSGYRGAHRSA